MSLEAISRAIMRNVTVVLVISACCSFSSANAEQRNEERTPSKSQSVSNRWQIIYIDGKKVGYARQTTSTIKSAKGATVFRTVQKESLTFKRFGQPIRLEFTVRTDEMQNGDLVSFDFELNNPPSTKLKSNGFVKGRKLVLESVVNGQRRSMTQNWKPGTKSSNYLERALKEKPLKPGERRTYKVFLPEASQAIDLRVTAEGRRRTKSHDGKTVDAMRVRVVQSILPDSPIHMYMNEAGEIFRMETKLMGLPMVMYDVPAQEALSSVAGAELDIALKTLVRVRPIRDPHKSKRIVYRIKTFGKNSAALFKVGSSQSVRRISDDTIELTVNSLRPDPYPRNVRTQPEFLKATQFLQSRDRNVVAHATNAAGGETNLTRVALKMERYVARKLKTKNLSTGFASAAEVAKSLEGDCTEHAVLLAAMLRVQKIPSRVVAGLVYTKRNSAFAGHMWTEAFLGGRWIPLDAVMGLGGIGAGHIKLSDSSLDDKQAFPITMFLPIQSLLGNMEIEVLKVEY